MGNVRGREQFGRESHEGDHSGKIIFFFFNMSLGFPGGSDNKESACNAGDRGSVPGSGTTYSSVWLHWVFSCGTCDLCCVRWDLSLWHAESLVVVCRFSRAST